MSPWKHKDSGEYQCSEDSSNVWTWRSVHNKDALGYLSRSSIVPPYTHDEKENNTRIYASAAMLPVSKCYGSNFQLTNISVMPGLLRWGREGIKLWRYENERLNWFHRNCHCGRRIECHLQCRTCYHVLLTFKEVFKLRIFCSLATPCFLFFERLPWNVVFHISSRLPGPVHWALLLAEEKHRNLFWNYLHPNTRIWRSLWSLPGITKFLCEIPRKYEVLFWVRDYSQLSTYA